MERSSTTFWPGDGTKRSITSSAVLTPSLPVKFSLKVQKSFKNHFKIASKSLQNRFKIFTNRKDCSKMVFRGAMRPKKGPSLFQHLPSCSITSCSSTSNPVPSPPLSTLLPVLTVEQKPCSVNTLYSPLYSPRLPIHVLFTATPAAFTF